MDAKFASSVAEIENPALQRAVFYLLSVVIASGLENNDELPPDLNHTLTTIWDQAGRNFDELIAAETATASSSPTTALELGLLVCQLPLGTPNEHVYQWLRGDGPILLSRPALQQPLDEFLKPMGEEALNFAKYMGRLMDHDMSQYIEPQDAIESPTCFLVTATIFFGLHLKNFQSDLAQVLFYHALSAVNDPTVWSTIEHFRGAPATAWIVTELEALKSEANA